MTAEDDIPTYAQLETGARFLATRAASAAERQLHLGMANRYSRLARGAEGAGEGRA